MIDDRDYYQETLGRMEPDIAAIDAAAGWASCSVSLKRIADTMVWARLVITVVAAVWVANVIAKTIVSLVLP